ncbi:MAG: ATP synthase F1 subunit epsilon [Oscillospiraceae bacterium]|nr:ATP synthase F1 subunit epsilon [Oscillospiraceae bacterium]MCD8066639.1 ATP synthase F1 subunit epsilon [Oscillospiraceae bacterium]
MNSFKLTILAAGHPFFTGESISVIFPTLDGQYGIMANHTNLVAGIVPGTLIVRSPDGVEHLAAVSRGIIKVEDNEVLLLVDSIERPEDIDENLAKQAMEDAQERLLQKRSLAEYRGAEAQLARSISRLRVKQGHSTDF